MDTTTEATNDGTITDTSTADGSTTDGTADTINDTTTDGTTTDASTTDGSTTDETTNDGTGAGKAIAKAAEEKAILAFTTYFEGMTTEEKNEYLNGFAKILE